MTFTYQDRSWPENSSQSLKERLFWSVMMDDDMPLVNAYYSEDNREILLNELSLEIKKFIASKLSCGEIDLKSEEVSVRLIKPTGSMIAPIELEIFAHEFEERVLKQDEICNEVRKFLLNKIPNVEDIRVWLILSQLGHSWD